jgi:hypothetical protein
MACVGLVMTSATEPLLSRVEIAIRLNTNLGTLKIPYSVIEVQRCVDRMPNITKSGNKYCIRSQDAGQVSALAV